MTTKKTNSKKAGCKKASKPRTIKVVEETNTGEVVESRESVPNAKPGKTAKSEPKEQRLSALDAAAKVLGESAEPLNTKQMVDTMSAKGYWTSPGGKTPHATLYSAILREIATKGNEARFKKTERGHFTINS
jgi:hypothetical protein